jgi:hypothetical protein
VEHLGAGHVPITAAKALWLGAEAPIQRLLLQTRVPKGDAMKLEPLMTIHADLKPPVDHGAGPNGTRLVFDVTGGHFEGARLRGTLLPSGGDWLLLDAEGVGHLDVRITLETDDGARIYVQYCGVIVMNEAVNRGSDTRGVDRIRGYLLHDAAAL